MLNSVAIGFVLELDDFLYDKILGASTKEAYENMPKAKTSTLALKRGAKIATIYGY